MLLREPDSQVLGHTLGRGDLRGALPTAELRAWGRINDACWPDLTQGLLSLHCVEPGCPGAWGCPGFAGHLGTSFDGHAL